MASIFLDVWTKKRHTVWNNSYLQYRKRRLLKQRLLVYLHRCASRCAHVWLWRHVCSLRGSSWWMWPLFEICILLLQWIIDTGIYVHGTENNILWLNFHNAFYDIFLIILLLDYKEFEFAWCVFKKISHSLPIAHVKIGYTFHGPLVRTGYAHPICELGVGWSLLNSSILLLFRQPLTSSIIVFTSGPTCLLVQTQLQSI